MAAKHAAEGTDSLSAQPVPEQATASTADEAVAMLEAGLGPMEWKRTYRALPEGGWVDEESGEILDTLPTGDPYTGPSLRGDNNMTPRATTDER